MLSAYYVYVYVMCVVFAAVSLLPCEVMVHTLMHAHMRAHMHTHKLLFSFL